MASPSASVARHLHRRAEAVHAAHMMSVEQSEEQMADIAHHVVAQQRIEIIRAKNRQQQPLHARVTTSLTPMGASRRIGNTPLRSRLGTSAPGVATVAATTTNGGSENSDDTAVGGDCGDGDAGLGQEMEQARQRERALAQPLAHAKPRSELATETHVLGVHDKMKSSYDLLVLMAAAGVALQVIEAELVFNNANQPTSTTTAIKAVVSASTVVLLWLVYVHYNDSLHLRRARTHSFTETLTSTGMLHPMLCEMCVCAIHSPPGLDAVLQIHYLDTVRGH